MSARRRRGGERRSERGRHLARRGVAVRAPELEDLPGQLLRERRRLRRLGNGKEAREDRRRRRAARGAETPEDNKLFAGGGYVALPGARRAHFGEQRLERLDRAGPPAKFRHRRDAAVGDIVVQLIIYNRLCIVATAVHQIKVRTSSQKLADDAERNVPSHCCGHQERRHAARGRPGVHRGPVLHKQTNDALVTHRGGDLGVGDRPMIRHSTPVVRQHGAMERRVPAPERTTRGGPVAQQDADGVHRSDPDRVAQRATGPLLDAGARRAEELGDGRARRPTRHAGVREERRARGLSVQFDRVGRAARREPLPDHLDPALARGERDLVLRNRPPSGTAFGGAALCVSSTATGQEAAAGQREATLEPKWEL